MQVVIDIPDEEYKRLVYIDMFKLRGYIENGTPLPQEHGRGIDVDEVVKEICIEYKANNIYELPDKLKSFVKKYLNEAPTILEPTLEYMIKNYAFSESRE